MSLPPISLVAIAVIVVLAIVVGLLIALKTNAGKSTGTSGNEFQLRPSLLSPAERSFAGVLDGTLPDGVTWLAKVRLGDVFVTRKGLTPTQRTRAWNRINQKHLDFLLVRTSDFAPVAGLELDDSSHEEEHRRRRDAFVDEVCRSSAFPLLHIKVQAAYNPSDLRNQISSLLERAQANPA